MKKVYNILMGAAVLSIFFSCQGGLPPQVEGGEGGENTPVELPEPPSKPNSANQFYVDFFSTLEDEGYFFETRDSGVASEYVKGQTGMKSVVYMFDRADFTVGVSHPFNKMSYDINVYQFFAQTKPTTATTTEGTGMVTRYIISRYDGLAQNGAYMSGCTIPVPLNKSTPICIYTTKITSLAQMEEIYKAKSQALQGDAVIIGTVDNKVKGEVTNYIKNTMALRAEVYGSNDTKMDLLVVVPASYVCRAVEDGMRVNLPYYRVLIEKWM